MDTEALGAQGEAVWARFVRRVEQLQGFGYLVLFVSNPALLAPFRARLGAWMAGRGWPWIQLSESRSADFAERSIAGLLDGMSASPPPRLAWLEAHRGAGQPAWDQARSELLSRLNERRGRLEAGLAGALVLVLPEGEQRRAAGLAPDLWHVRSLGLSLAGTPPASPGSPDLEPVAAAHDLPTPSPMAADRGSPAPTLAHEASPAAGPPAPAWSDAQAASWLRHWQGVLAGRPIEQLPLEEEELLALRLDDGLASQGALLRQGREAEGLLLGDQWIALSRRRCAQGAGLLDVATRRELAAVLEAQGTALRCLGLAREALPICEERLAVARELAARLGETPVVLRDLARALDQLCLVTQALGDWRRAADLAEEALVLHRKLASRLGETPGSLRGLAAALDRVGQVAQALGDWYRAGAAYEEGLSLRQALASRAARAPATPDAAEALRELSAALDNIGRVAEAQGDWARGAEAYEEAQTLRRLLRARAGASPASAPVPSFPSAQPARSASMHKPDAASPPPFSAEELLAPCRAGLAQLGTVPELEAQLAAALLDASGLSAHAAAHVREAGEILASLRRRFPGVDRYARLQQQWTRLHAKFPPPLVPTDPPPPQPQAGSSSK